MCLSGVPQGATRGTLVATYNDLAGVEALLKTTDVAAVILEPVVGNSGFIKPTKEFLQGLRDLTTKYGALLVFDEVMTGFRIAYGGAQEYFGVIPDVTTMGKVIGEILSPPALLVSSPNENAPCISQAAASLWEHTAAARTSCPWWPPPAPCTRPALSLETPWQWLRESRPWRF